MMLVWQTRTIRNLIDGEKANMFLSESVGSYRPTAIVALNKRHNREICKIACYSSEHIECMWRSFEKNNVPCNTRCNADR